MADARPILAAVADFRSVLEALGVVDHSAWVVSVLGFVGYDRVHYSASLPLEKGEN